MNNENTFLDNSNSEYVLEVENLKQYFPIERSFFGKPTKYLKAVDGVSFKIKRGHTFGLVGESGCGKTTLGRTIISLYEATDGKALFNGENVLAYSKKDKARQEKELKAHLEAEAYREWLIWNTKLSDAEISSLYLDDREKVIQFLPEKRKEFFVFEDYHIAVAKRYLAYLKFWKFKELREKDRELNLKERNREFDEYYNYFSGENKAKMNREIEKITLKYLEDNSNTTLEQRLEKKQELKEKIKVEKCENFLSSQEKRALKTKLQMIFQDPYSSLSPRMCVGEIISEAVLEHKLVSKAEIKDYTFKIMKECGLQPFYYQRYPHEFSGGQRQRIGIARSLALNPSLVICDEPVSALDVSIQAQIINLLKDLQKEKGLSYLFISHDLSVVEHISDDVGVMYLGNMVESGTKDQIFNNPCHPYTLALLSAIPQPDPDMKSDRIKLRGELPSPANPPRGCKFHTRCNSCMEICKRVAPIDIEVEPGHIVRCHLFNKDTKENE